MKRAILLFVISIGLSAVRVIGAERPLAPQTPSSAELDSFFRALGFEDYNARIEESLEKGRALNDIGTDALRINYRRYSMVNHARQIATLMLTSAYPRLQNREFRKNFITFAVKFLTLKPLAPPLDLPQEIKDAGPMAVDTFLESVSRNNMRFQSAAIIAEYLELFHGGPRPDVKELSNLMARYIKRVYLDAQIGNTQWLGRALLLGLARYGVTQDQTVFDELKAEVKKQDLFVENYIGSTLVLVGKDGPRRVQIKTGDLVFERSREVKESAAITAVALPEDEKTAVRDGLVGSLLDTVWDVSQDARANGLTWIQRKKIVKAQEDSHSRGMSHVAQLVVYHDDRTRIEQTLIWDDYPYSIHLDVDKDEEWGGIRVNGFEHFANPGDVMRVGVVTLNKEKLFRVAKDRLAVKKKQGWNKYAWISYVPKINKDREILPQEKPIRHDWEYQISQNDFFRLHGISDQDQWFEEYQERLVKGWKTMMTDWGIWFYWIDAGAGLDERGKFQPGRYWFGGMYCSQAVNFASLLFTGLDLEVRPSHYAGYLAWIQRTGIKKARQLDVNAPVIAPSSLALQPYSDPLIQVIYPPYNLAALAQFEFNMTALPEFRNSALIPEKFANDPWDKGEQKALITRERKFIEYINLENGKNLAQIFGKGQKADSKKALQAATINFRRSDVRTGN